MCSAKDAFQASLNAAFDLAHKAEGVGLLCEAGAAKTAGATYEAFRSEGGCGLGIGWSRLPKLTWGDGGGKSKGKVEKAKLQCKNQEDSKGRRPR